MRRRVGKFLVGNFCTAPPCSPSKPALGLEPKTRSINLSSTTESDLWGRLARKQGIIMQINGCAIVRTLSRTMVVAATKFSADAADDLT